MMLGFLLRMQHVALGVPLVIWGGAALALTMRVGVFALRAAARARTVFLLSAVLVGLGLGMFVLGAIGQAQLMAARDSIAAQGTSPEERMQLWEGLKFHEQACLVLGGLLGLLPACAGVALVGQGLSRLDRFRE